MKNLKQLRLNSHLSQEELSKKLGLTRATYGFYEAEKVNPSLETVTKIADYFGCSVDYLLGHETKGIIHLDNFTPAQQKLLEMIKLLNPDQALFLTGYISAMLKLPFDQVKPVRPW